MENGQFTAGVNQVTKIATDNKGSVLTSTSDNDRSGTFTLRIPEAHFDRVMTALRDIAPAGGILYQDSTGKDVTASFIDFHARLGILKKQRALLIGLQSKVTDAGQILFYADKINAVQLNIETIQGDLNFLNDSVAAVHHQGGAPREGRTGGNHGHRRQQAQPALGVELQPPGVPAGAGRRGHRSGLPDPPEHHRAADLGRGHAGAAEASRSQLSARNRSAAVEARAASSPVRPSVAPNQASASIHARSISSSGRSSPFARNEDTEP